MSPSKLRFLDVSDSNFFHWTGPEENEIISPTLKALSSEHFGGV